MNPFSPAIMHSTPDIQECGHLQLHHPADFPANARKSKHFAEGTLATAYGIFDGKFASSRKWVGWTDRSADRLAGLPMHARLIHTGIFVIAHR
jgi:hypothetical protein